MKNNIFTVCVDGSIGVGKSTMIDILKSNFNNWEFVPEPVNEWINTGILDAFYKDMERYSYTFQNKVFIDRTRVLMDCNNTSNNITIRVVERSPYADRHCFAKNCYESGLMNNMEWNIYTEWFDWLSEKISLSEYIDMFVYLECDPQTSYDRIKIRGRKEEDNMSFDYLNKLSNLYDNLYNNINKKSPILKLDASIDFKNNIDNRNRYVKNIHNSINDIIKTIV